MPVSCCIVGCTNSGKNSKVSFYQIPKVSNREGKATEELLKRRRAAWIKAINRKGITDEVLQEKKWFKVCGDHFISGKPSYAQYEQSVDWVPSLKLGYSKDTPMIPNIPLNKRSKKQLATWSDRESEDEGHGLSTDGNEKQLNPSLRSTLCYNEPTGGLIMSAESTDDTMDNLPHQQEEAECQWFSEQEEAINLQKPKGIKDLLPEETFNVATNKDHLYTADKWKGCGKKGKISRENCSSLSLDVNLGLDHSTVKPVMLVKAEDIDELQKAARKSETFASRKNSMNELEEVDDVFLSESSSSDASKVWPVMILKAKDFEELENESGVAESVNVDEVEYFKPEKQGLAQEKVQAELLEHQVREKQSVQEKQGSDRQSFAHENQVSDPENEAYEEREKQVSDNQSVVEENKTSVEREKQVSAQKNQAVSEKTQTENKDDQRYNSENELEHHMPVSDGAVFEVQTKSSESHQATEKKASKRKTPPPGPSSKVLKSLPTWYEFELICQSMPATEGLAVGSGEKNMAIIRPVLKYKMEVYDQVGSTINSGPKKINIEIMKCFTCQQDFGSLDSFGKHACPNINQESFSCLLCNKLVPREQFQDHTVKHMQDKMVPHKCSFCGLRFSDAKSLTDHHLLEHGFSCDICGMRFPQESMIQQHKLCHHKKRIKRIYRCRFCRRKFEKHSALCKHLMKHEEGIKVYCGFCKKGFPRLDQLKLHVKQNCKEGKVSK